MGTGRSVNKAEEVSSPRGRQLTSSPTQARGGREGEEDAAIGKGISIALVFPMMVAAEGSSLF